MECESLEVAAQRLATAHTAGLIDDMPILLESIEDAYAIQKRTVDLLGTVGGWKHGLLGGRTLACAPVIHSAIFRNGASLQVAPCHRIEVETAFHLVRPINAAATSDEIIDAIGGVHIAFECLGSRFEQSALRGSLEIMADRFSNRAIIIGDIIPNWRARDLAILPIETNFADAKNHVSAGMSFAKSVEFLSFLAGRAAAIGCRLDAGQYVITGARLGPIPVGHSGTLQARIGSAEVSVQVDL